MGGFSTPIWTPTSPVQIYGSSDLNNWSEIFDRWFDEECWQYYQSYSSF
jgi:hypothetical protein